ncbi:MAG TPA: GNAT family N-acetyltransferase [Abditibacteriaceae bacterium]|nr:GNAT family N-acetyltransferase [Abditibacteriaceae bacterium]
MTNILFRKLKEDDVPLLHRWLNTRHVQQWYTKADVSLDEVRTKYLPRIRGEAPTHAYLILLLNKPVGYIQTYRIRDYPEYSRALQVDEDAASLDLFIGEADHLHRGLGSIIIREFLQQIVWETTGASCCWIGPQVGNHIAIRAYEKAGFQYVKTVQVPNELDPAYLMRIAR